MWYPTIRPLVAMIFLGLVPAMAPADPTPGPASRFAYDTRIEGGWLVDGTGGPRRLANVYLHDGLISAITSVDDVRPAERVIEAQGLIVAPGFIDTHAHGDPIRTPEFGNFLAMGVTTICLGQDGESPENVTGWMQSVAKVRLGPNVALFAGHGTARNAVGIGNQIDPSPQQIEAMQDWIGAALADGCFGLTTGLEYQPGSFAKLDELVAIAQPVASAGGLIMSHLRSEDDDAIATALAELIEQGKRAGCPVHVSHLKVTYGHGSERAEALLAQIESARQSGVTITADLYPYLASYTGIGIVFPDWAKPPHDYEEVVETKRDELAAYLRERITLRNGPEATLLATPPWTGKTLARVAKELEKPFEDVLIDDIGLNNNVRGAYFVMDADLQDRLMQDPYVMICSDGSPTMRHPRGYGAFARILRDFVVERKLVTLEEAVRKMSHLSAQATGLNRLGRGKLAVGYAADLLVLNPVEVRDHATFEEPFQFATGYRWVFVNGQPAVADGTPTATRSGVLLRNRGEHAGGRTRREFAAAELDELVSRLLQKFAGTEVPGAAIAIVKDGEPVLLKTAGMADIDNHAPIETNTNFRLASMTKQFTAFAILQLIEQGKLAMDDPISKFFPAFADIGNQINVGQLVWHTSGILDYEELMPADQATQLSDEDVLRLAAPQDKTYFAPGTEHRYSNTGYALLALIVEKVSGERFAEYLRGHVFQPLGMHRTVAFENGVSTVADRAYGYAETDGRFIDADQSMTSAVLGDGGVYTSIADYLKWDQSLYASPLLKRETLARAFRPGTSTKSPSGYEYGFGWRIENRHGVQVLHHDGRTSGFSNAVRRVPEQRISVVVLTNRAGGHAATIADEILASLFR